MSSLRLFTMASLYIFTVNSASAQNLPAWHTSPAPIAINRYDDITFLNDHLGWAIDFGGELLKTTDAGNTWQVLNGPIGYFYRCVCFLDSLHGFIGKLDTSVTTPADTNFFYKTIDGGNSWSVVSNFPGPRPAGICGMFHVTDSVLYAVGRYFGPAGIYKTTDKGITWHYIDMSAYATGLVDCYFWSPDSGIVVGDRGIVHAWDSGGVVLSTFDGGISWQQRYDVVRPSICWKISFPSRKTGYVSIESFDNISNEYFLKTTDGGLTWEEKLYATQNYDAEGIGFINDSVGWIGGSFSNSYATADGGNTWIKDTIGIVQVSPNADSSDGALNRFRFISDTLGFGSGVAIYRYSKEGFISGITQLAGSAPNQLEIYPNPSNTKISVSFMKKSGNVKLSIQTYLGQNVLVMPVTFFEAGKQNLEINTVAFQNGIYFLILEADHSISSSRFVINR